MSKAFRQRGQGMTEYIIIVALIAVAAIGIYQAFGDVVRAQTSIAVSALGGYESGGAQGVVTAAQGRSNTEGAATKTLRNFRQGSQGE
jgi:type IV pilus assembly protein PilA